MAIHRILVVDDDSLSRQFLTEAVRTLGYSPMSAVNGREALEHLRAHTGQMPDLVLSDMRMPGMSGIELVDAIQTEWPGLPVVVITAHGTIDGAVDAMRKGAVDFLMKPCSPDTLELVIDRLSREARLEAENEYLRSEVGAQSDSPFIAESSVTIDLLRSTARIARSKGTVLVTGESGTGKERIAHYIHGNSPRADKPFIRVNCAALSEQLLESELFGHERGAFTGAHKTRIGRFELADGGTILLDELGEISMSMQTKLLRVLQEEEFERVGGQSTIKVDTRVIAATNKNLATEVAEGRFREDLYYRLHVLPLHVAPLRERVDDILPLAEHFAAAYARNNGLPAPTLDEGTRQRLLTWSWPGNVRELENVIQRAVILGRSGSLVAEDLVFGPTLSTNHASNHAPDKSIELGDLQMATALANNPVAEIERIAILATLESTGGNKTEAARRLGLTARTLSNKMKIWRQSGLVA
ncbi:MAG: DNA-binding NtrC family response regulator [Planctomycetota bacterium]|jgi:DNA-binding NtrC family response regulator